MPQKPVNVPANLPYADASSVSVDERAYYQPDEYYTRENVISFEERKQISKPSANGLYAAEVLLLEYCKHGAYPKPKNGYPALWWFQYGIRDVGHALESLEERGFIRKGPKNSIFKSYGAAELKEVLLQAGLSAKGKKEVLLERAMTEIPEEQINIPENMRKYELTDLGEAELSKNGYVPYMHAHRFKTLDLEGDPENFSLWYIDRMVKDSDDPDWRVVVGHIEETLFGVNMASNVPQGESAIHIENSKIDKAELQDEMKKYLVSMKTVITTGVLSKSRAYDEYRKGSIYASLGDDKAAIVQYYIAMGKEDPELPSVYFSAADLLEQYGMQKEALKAINAGLRVVSKRDVTYKKLEERRAKIKERMENKETAN